jgi:hypothetical protein
VRLPSDWEVTGLPGNSAQTGHLLPGSQRTVSVDEIVSKMSQTGTLTVVVGQFADAQALAGAQRPLHQRAGDPLVDDLPKVRVIDGFKFARQDCTSLLPDRNVPVRASSVASEAVEKRAEAVPDDRDLVAALLHHEDRQAEVADPFADGPEARRCDLQHAERIIGMGIVAEREHERLCAEIADAAERGVDRREEGRVVAAWREGQVEVVALSLVHALLVGVADEVGVVGLGVDMDRGVEDVAAAVKDLLRAVAVMGIDIEDRDAAEPLAQTLGADGGVVEIAESRGPVGAGVGLYAASIVLSATMGIPLLWLIIIVGIIITINHSIIGRTWGQS